MMQLRGRARVLVAAAFAILAQGCNGSDSPAARSDRAAGRDAASKYPEPRWPSYFKPPEKVDDLMPAARAVVRNRSGLQGGGLGMIDSGESVLIVLNASADPLVIEAIKRALVERKITAHFKTPAELQGGAGGGRGRGGRGARDAEGIRNAGTYQASSWITGQFPDPSKPRAWLKERRPDLYKELFPNEADGSNATQAPQDGTGRQGLTSFSLQTWAIGSASSLPVPNCRQVPSGNWTTSALSWSLVLWRHHNSRG